MLTWDLAKDAKNRQRHHISLARFADMAPASMRVVRDEAHSTAAETRWHVIGLIDGRVYLAVLTYRDGHERIISLRPASRRERTRYEAT